MKTCCKCRIPKPDTEFNLVGIRRPGKLRGKCRPCQYEVQRKYNLAHPEMTREGSRRWRSKNREKANQLKQESRRFKLRGLTGIEFESRYNLSPACEICKEPFASRSEACVDHCHRSGKFRGLLCGKCNAGLGLFRDSTLFLISAKNYLERQV